MINPIDEREVYDNLIQGKKNDYTFTDKLNDLIRTVNQLSVRVEALEEENKKLKGEISKCSSEHIRYA